MIKVIILLTIFIILVLIRKALVPLAFAIGIAYILNPLVDYLEKKFSGKRLLCVMISYLVIIAIIAFLIFGFADIAMGEFSSYSLTSAIKTLKLYYYEHKGVLDNIVGFSIEKYDIGKLLKSFSSMLLKFLIGMVAAVYLLKDKDFFLNLGKKAMHLLLSQRLHGILREIFFEINAVISSFIKGVLIDSVIVAFFSSLALTIIGVDFAIFIGVFAGITNVIPYFGPIIGIIPAFLVELSKGDIGNGILAAILLFLVQQIECNFIYPKIIGSSTGLHPLFVLMAVSIAGYFGGLFWMVMAVPIAGIINVLVKKWAYA